MYTTKLKFVNLRQYFELINWLSYTVGQSSSTVGIGDGWSAIIVGTESTVKKILVEIENDEKFSWFLLRWSS
jgi:hypothetical protein